VDDGTRTPSAREPTKGAAEIQANIVIKGLLAV